MTKLSFFAPINQDSFNGLIDAISKTQGPIEIKFASGGGEVDVGFRMYNYLRSLEPPVTMHCYGDVRSIAVIVFLAADIRIADASSVFGIHRLSCELRGGTSLRTLKECESSLLFDINRYNDIFTMRTSKTDTTIDILDTLCGGNELLLNVHDAFRTGIVTAIS